MKGTALYETDVQGDFSKRTGALLDFKPGKLFGFSLY